MKDVSKNDGPMDFQTARIKWHELQRFFAKGDVIQIDSKLDLVDMAHAFLKDDKILIQTLMKQNKICKMPDETAKQWFVDNLEIWAVVVAPWVLVQK